VTCTGRCLPREPVPGPRGKHMPWSLRQAVFQLWCCARSTPAGSNPSTVAAVALAGARRQRRKLTAYFGVVPEACPICIEYEAVGRDADEFDRAFETKNWQAMGRLLESDEPVDRLVEPKHQWAEDARTVGALAAMCIGLVACLAPNKAADDGDFAERPEGAAAETEIRAEILTPEAREQLIVFLGCEEVDRVQAAVIALNYLTFDCGANAEALYHAGALPLLIKHMDSPVAGLRGAAASTSRHICVQHDDFREAFVSLGGMKGFVSQLDPQSDHSEMHDPEGSMLEAVWNLEDVTTDSQGNLIERYASLAAELGAIEKLTRLKKVGDSEVTPVAERVLAALAKVHQNGNGCHPKSR